MRILNVKFNASTKNFLSLVIPSAVFKVFLVFGMYFCLKNNTDLYLFIYFNYLFYLFIYLLFVPSNSLRSIL